MNIINQKVRDSQDLWLGKPAPRYTSYPPAPFFHTAVAEANFAKSLKQLDPDEPVSLYIHIPFCRSLCLYCGCNTSITQRSERISDYLSALKKEISLTAKMMGPHPVRQLHFGGGTPNSLSNEQLLDLFHHLHDVFRFDNIQEIAMELDPRLVTEEQVRTLSACGITRVSFGIQDFDHEVQTVIHRIQPFSMVEQVCTWFRAEGIDQINFDLIYGLPKQTAQTITNTTQLSCLLKPSRVALFSYAHVPQLKNHQKVLESYGLPDVHESLALEQIARGILTSHHYYAIGIDHFALHNDRLSKAWRSGKMHRCFQGYTEDDTPIIIGFGASSISQTKEGYFQNERDEFVYQKILGKNQSPVLRGFILSEEDHVHRTIIEQLMCRFACDVQDVCKLYNYPIENLAPNLAKLEPFIAAGLVTRHEHVLCVTTPYRMAVRVVCAAFDNYSCKHSSVPASRTA